MSQIVIDRQKALNRFAEYVKAYNDEDSKVRLKIEHTYRVAGLCQAIGLSIGLTDSDLDLAWLVGLLHDVGRFEQLRNYGTFNDAESIDHAQYGSSILFNDGLIRSFLDDPLEDELIKNAVYWHSAFKIPEDFDDRTKMYCNILRDADKIDIFKVNCDFPLEEIYNATTEEVQNSEVTKEVMDSFFEEHAVLRSLKKTVVDNVVGHISLVYELVYPESIRQAVKQGYLNKLMSFTSKNPATNEKFASIREHIADFIKRKTTNI